MHPDLAHLANTRTYGYRMINAPSTKTTIMNEMFAKCLRIFLNERNKTQRMKVLTIDVSSLFGKAASARVAFSDPANPN